MEKTQDMIMLRSELFVENDHWFYLLCAVSWWDDNILWFLITDI